MVKFQATFYYTILYSGVKSLRIDVPAEAVGVRNVAPAIRDKVIDPPPADLAKGSAAWSFTGQSELIGNGKIELVWEKKIDHLEVGKSVEIGIPRLIPRGVDRAWGQIVLAKAETLDVQPAGDPKGLRPIDPQRDLIAEVPGAAAAFEFQGDWALTAAVARYQLEEIKRTSIDRAVVRMVVAPAGVISVQAVYRVQSARQRLTIHLPDNPQFDVDPLRLNGRIGALGARRPKRRVFRAAAERQSRRAVPPGDSLYNLRRRQPSGPAGLGRGRRGAAGLSMRLFAGRQGAAGAAGPWTEESSWPAGNAIGRSREPGADYGNALVAWVREGTKAGEVGQFPTDGKLHVYSALRPAPPPEGSLHTVSWNERGLNAAVFLVAIALGVILLPAKMGRLRWPSAPSSSCWCSPAFSAPPFPGKSSTACWPRPFSSCWSFGSRRTRRCGFPPKRGDGARRQRLTQRRRRSPAKPPQDSPRPARPPNRRGPKAREGRRMRSPSPSRRLPLMLLAAALLSGVAAVAEDEPPQKVREILVPFQDLNVLLENQPRRVLLSRREYDDLVRRAKVVPVQRAPRPFVVAAADYSGTSDGQRVRLTGELTIDVLDEGLDAVPLDLGWVGLLEAKLDGRDAPLGRDPAGQICLLVEGVGRHKLALEMAAPLETAAAQQTFSIRLPRAGAGRLRLVVPGDVELRSGAAVADRQMDRAAGVTRFELLPTVGDAALVLSLNSHAQRRQEAVLARSVLIDEVAEGCEKLHAAVSLSILYRAVDRFRFVVPEGFEITNVSSPLLARWDIQVEGGRRIANVRLREQTNDPVIVRVEAFRAGSPTEAWKLPQLEPLDVVGRAAVVGVLLEQPLKIESLQAENLIPIDASVLAQAMPEAVRAPTEVPLVPAAAYYAPQGSFGLSGRFVMPAAEMDVASNVLLIVGDGGLEARGRWAISPCVRKQFAFDFSLPAGWEIASVTDPHGACLPVERYGSAAQAGRVHVRLPRAVPPGVEYCVNFCACERRPVGWPIGSRSPSSCPSFPLSGRRAMKGPWPSRAATT